MPRKTIYVTLGQTKYVGGLITALPDEDGNPVNISADPIVMALGDYDPPPARTTGVTPSDDQPQTNTATRIPKLLIDNTFQAADDVWCWAWLTDSPEIEPIRLDGPITIVV